MNKCLVCAEAECEPLIDFGCQPICHHFYSEGQKPETTFPLILAQCRACGLTQLEKQIPILELVPRFDWISYNEPEKHLDDCVKVLSQLPGIKSSSSIWGLTYKEDTTLRRFNDRGFHNTRRLNFDEDLGISDPRAGIESFQSKIEPGLMRELNRKYGAPDMVIARHVLEHATNPGLFMNALRELVKPDGYVIFEVPDCGRAFEVLDYTTLWEDHCLYFVTDTFLKTLEFGGFSIQHFEKYTAPYENCLVAVTRPVQESSRSDSSRRNIESLLIQARNFATSYPARKRQITKTLSRFREQGGIALFGAGHQSAMFVNLMEVRDKISAVLDDHPKKKGLQMPGSRLKIVGSEALKSDQFRFCLSSLSAESEQKILQKHADFLMRGGTFFSIFPTTKAAVFNSMAGSRLPEDVQDS